MARTCLTCTFISRRRSRAAPLKVAARGFARILRGVRKYTHTRMHRRDLMGSYFYRRGFSRRLSSCLSTTTIKYIGPRYAVVYIPRIFRGISIRFDRMNSRSRKISRRQTVTNLGDNSCDIQGTSNPEKIRPYTRYRFSLCSSSRGIPRRLVD